MILASGTGFSLFGFELCQYTNFKCKQAEAAEKWRLRASGVKTPDESNALTSWLKPRPTNLPTFSSAFSACSV
jgi:hypothetical protein